MAGAWWLVSLVATQAIRAPVLAQHRGLNARLAEGALRALHVMTVAGYPVEGSQVPVRSGPRRVSGVDFSRMYSTSSGRRAPSRH